MCIGKAEKGSRTALITDCSMQPVTWGTLCLSRKHAAQEVPPGPVLLVFWRQGLRHGRRLCSRKGHAGKEEAGRHAIRSLKNIEAVLRQPLVLERMQGLHRRVPQAHLGPRDASARWRSA